MSTVNYVDQQLVRLADPATRADIFDDVALEQLVDAAYEAADMSVEGPFAPSFDEFHLGVATLPLGTLEGTWSPVGGVERTEAYFRVDGLGDGGLPRVDAFWRGSITARFAPAGERITSVVTTIPDSRTIDAEITFEPPHPVTETPEALPIAAALLIRPLDGLSVAQMLADSKNVRDRLLPYRLEAVSDPTLRLREPLLVVWIVPAELFDDGDWPGGGTGTPLEQRAARRGAAGEWLAREGIGLAVTQ